MSGSAPRSESKAAVSMVLGVVAAVTVLSFAAALVIDIDWLDSLGGWWLLFPTVAFWTGAAAAFLGTLGWIDARRGATASGLRSSQAGAILGGTTVAIVVIGMVVLLILFVTLVASFSEGMD